MENQAPGAGNEIQLTDAIDTLNKTQRVFAREFIDRYDVMTSLASWFIHRLRFLKHPQVKDDLEQYIIELGKKLEEKTKNKIQDEIRPIGLLLNTKTPRFN